MTDAMWHVYFASVASFQFHPGAGTKLHEALTLDECADVADRMLAIALERKAIRDAATVDGG